MKKKTNPALLKEELKKFRLLTEYSFYTEEPKQDDDLLLGSTLDEVDNDPNDENTAPDPNAPVDDSKTAGNAATPPDGAAPAPDPNAPVDPNAAPDPNAPADDADNVFGTGEEMPNEDPMADIESLGGAEDDAVEVDVTQLVQSGEEAKDSADKASRKSSVLLHKFNDLERRVSAMDSIASKIEALEKEVIKRNPTPVEKLEMRSMNSFPYNIKLTDYWKDVDGYDPISDDEQNKEFVLKRSDFDSSQVDTSIKGTFDVPTDYEEEDITD